MTMKEIDKLVDRQRAKLELDFAQKHKQLIATTEVFRQTLEVCKSRGWHIHAELWNIGIYINLAAHDLSVLVQQLHFERDDWTRRLVARHVVLLMYEVTEDMTQLLGKKIREPLNVLELLPSFEANLRSARQPLDRFWKQHQDKLSEIRCISAAHRDLDGLSLLRTIESIDIQEVAELGLEVGRILEGIGDILQSILKEASAIQPPELNADA